MMDRIINKLKSVDWDFADYNSLLYPADINSLHWYPGTFVPQIPSILINLLSEENQLVLDPFAGSGVTLIESAKQKRKAIGIDQNPYAVNIVNAKIIALSAMTEKWCVNESERITDITKDKADFTSQNKVYINAEVERWFHPNTLKYLLKIFTYINDHEECDSKLILKVLFSSILNRCCSQREHYTYITDRCFPKEHVEIDVKKIYLEKINDLQLIIKENSTYQQRVYGQQYEISKYCNILKADSRKLQFLDDDSIDLIVTSPPYLGVNDYVRSSYLMSLFFPEFSTEDAINNEIGARRKRNRKNIQEEYVKDMESCFDQIERVLKPNSFFCLIIGQGRGKAVKNDLIEQFRIYLETKYNFSLIFSEFRKIKFRRIQVPGIGNETILVFKSRQ